MRTFVSKLMSQILNRQFAIGSGEPQPHKLMQTVNSFALTILAFVAGGAAPLHAAGVAIDLRASAATAVTASSFYTEGSPSDCLPASASDWSGMTGSFPDGTAGTEWWTSWASAAHDDLNYLAEWIEWDLGGTYTLTKMHVWNFNEGGYTDEGIKKLDVQQWTGTAWENVFTGLEWTKATDAADYAGFDQEFDTPITTSKIRFANLENYGSTYGAGVGEVVFYALPQPLRISGITADPVSGNVVLQWSGGWDGMQFQVEKAADSMGPFEPLGDPQTGREYTDAGALHNNRAAFYRIKGW